MNERLSDSSPFESQPRHGERDASFENVAKRVAELLDALEETMRRFPEVALPNGELMAPSTGAEELLARAQRLEEGLRGYREQVGARGEYHEERAVALLEDAVRHLTEYLAVRADLENIPGARALAGVLDRIMERLTLPHMEETAAPSNES